MTTTDNDRLHAEGEPPPRPGGEFVLYWIQTAMRARANPALNFAVEQANRDRLPLVVYQGLRPDYPWASDRLHAFILESVVDLRRDFADRGIQYAFHLEPRPGGRPDRSSPLQLLASRARVVVTDYFPTFIVPGQVRGLRRRVETPVVAVDGSTVVPMRWHERAWPSARGIRPRLLQALPHFLHPVPDPDPRIRRAVELPFDPTIVTSDLIPRLVAGCEIDHAVSPAPNLRGGRHAGLRQLEEFVTRRLLRYADERNDPCAEATSGLSPYLHFGNLSINEVLLRARAAGPPADYEKFQDEALVWRELAHNFVHLDPGHAGMSAVPEWARRELDAHASDPRTELYSEEELEGAGTGDELWNACQRALVRDGSLHGYLRMLWGKAVIGWTQRPEEALRLLIHLNNKYALDGRDPNSYGGILWCFGKFDRPFYRRPVYGTVRYMSLGAARKKFDAASFIGRYPA